MDILKRYTSLISQKINSMEIVERLRSMECVDDTFVDKVKKKNGKKTRVTEMLKLLEEQNNYEGIVKLWDVLKEDEDLIKEIPELTGVRLEISLGNKRILKITRWQEEDRIDIREYEVSYI